MRRARSHGDKFRFGADHCLRLPGAGGAVEIDQRLTVDLPVQYRENRREPVLPGKCHVLCLPANAVQSRASTCSLSASLRIASVSSAAKAYRIICCAACCFDTARAQIEQLLFVNAPHRRPVAAFHVIGVNFQLRFGVDLPPAARAADYCWSSDRRFSARAARRLISPLNTARPLSLTMVLCSWRLVQ